MTSGTDGAPPQPIPRRPGSDVRPAPERLGVWQLRLAELVVNAALPSAARPQDPPAVDDWWTAVSRGTGLRLTRRIRRSWCVSRVLACAPLTAPLLPDAPGLAGEWVDRGGGAAAFASRDSIPFLDFVSERLDTNAHVFSVCRFERAVYWAVGVQRERRSAMAVGAGHDDKAGVSLVRFLADPEAVLGCALARAPLPPREGSERWVMVSPAIDGLYHEVSV